MKIRLATAEDVPQIMALERGEGFETLVGRWSAAEHEREIANPASSYFLAEDQSAGLVGFAMVQGLGDPNRKAHLRRIVVARTGEGIGTQLMRLLLDWLYSNSDVNRIDLDVYVDKDRARRSYEKAGFKTEGQLRDFHRNEDGSFRDMWLMSILRTDWSSIG